MSAPGRTPSSVQRVALSVLAEGGFIDPGTPDHQGPRLFEADGRLFGLLARSTLDILVKLGWTTLSPPTTRRLRYVATAAGLKLARRSAP